MLSESPAHVHFLYLNGLGTGKSRVFERLAAQHAARHGLSVTHVPINWFSGESFEAMLERVTELTRQKLAQQTQLIILGVSAGGSLAVNVLGRLQDPNLSVITVCSRLQLARLPWWDIRSLELMTLQRRTLLGRSKSSRSFFDSVTYCNNTTIPSLTPSDKKRILTVEQWMDNIVPKPTMTIPGVKVYHLPVIGHGMGIGLAWWQLPKIVQEFRTSQ